MWHLWQVVADGRQRQIYIEAKRNRESGKEEYREGDRETEQVVLIMHLLRKWIFT